MPRGVRADRTDHDADQGRVRGQDLAGNGVHQHSPKLGDLAAAIGHDLPLRYFIAPNRQRRQRHDTHGPSSGARL